MATYGQLQQSVKDWLDRDDLDILVKDFIRIAQQRTNRVLRLIQMESYQEQNLSDVTNQYPLPDRWISFRNVQTSEVHAGKTGKKLTYVTPEIMALTKGPNNDLPKQYTIVNGVIELDTIVAAESTDILLQLSYFKAFDEYISDVDTDWLLDNAYDLLLYESIIAAQIYLIDDPRIPLLKQMTQQIIDDLNQEAEEGRYSGDTLRIRAT